MVGADRDMIDPTLMLHQMLEKFLGSAELLIAMRIERGES